MVPAVMCCQREMARGVQSAKRFIVSVLSAVIMAVGVHMVFLSSICTFLSLSTYTYRYVYTRTYVYILCSGTST